MPLPIQVFNSLITGERIPWIIILKRIREGARRRNGEEGEFRSNVLEREGRLTLCFVVVKFGNGNKIVSLRSGGGGFLILPAAVVLLGLEMCLTNCSSSSPFRFVSSPLTLRKKTLLLLLVLAPLLHAGDGLRHA